jgi:hypothetical protein
MVKYNIEEGIDFYKELYESLHINNNHEETDTCLITNQLLTDRYVTLDCGHKFNYIPLYNDLKNHKKLFNCLEACNGRLNTNEIRCPYCRSKQSKLLPYYDDLGVEKVNGVNFFDPHVKNSKNSNISHYNHKCEYKCPNTNYDISKPESNNNPKYLGCYKMCCTKIILYNSENPSQPITYGDNKYYCYAHKRKMIQKYKLQEKEKKKEISNQLKAQNKAEKEKAKEQVKLAKQKMKEELKLAKQKTKLEKNINLSSENVILESSIIINQDMSQSQDINQVGCKQILKTGIKKGQPCGCKIYSEIFVSATIY